VYITFTAVTFSALLLESETVISKTLICGDLFSFGRRVLVLSSLTAAPLKVQDVISI
jgi:hypothetical protein